MEKYARHVPMYLFYLLIFNLTDNIVEKCHRCGVWPVWTVPIPNDKQGLKIFHILQVAQTPTHCPAQVEICSPNVTCSKPSMSGFAGFSPVLMRTAVWRQRRRRRRRRRWNLSLLSRHSSCGRLYAPSTQLASLSLPGLFSLINLCLLFGA